MNVTVCKNDADYNPNQEYRQQTTNGIGMGDSGS